MEDQPREREFPPADFARKPRPLKPKRNLLRRPGRRWATRYDKNYSLPYLPYGHVCLPNVKCCTPDVQEMASELLQRLARKEWPPYIDAPTHHHRRAHYRPFGDEEDRAE